MKVVDMEYLLKAGEVDVPALPYVFSPAFSAFQKKANNSVHFVLKNDIIIPFVLYKKSIFKIIQFLYVPLRNGRELPAAEEAEFLEYLVIFLSANRVAHRIISPYLISVFKEKPAHTTFCSFGCYSIDLTKSEDALFSEINSAYKRQIKTALKNGL